jgi:hypothetical protein
MIGDHGYGPLGHGVATRNRLDALYDQYDFLYHVGVRVGWLGGIERPLTM